MVKDVWILGIRCGIYGENMSLRLCLKWFCIERVVFRGNGILIEGLCEVDC